MLRLKNLFRRHGADEPRSRRAGVGCHRGERIPVGTLGAYGLGRFSQGLLVICVLFSGPRWAWGAQDTPPEVTSTEKGDLPLDLAHAHFEQGAVAYEAGDYTAAAAAWTLAYDLLARDPQQVRARSILSLDVGQAQLHAYRKDGQRSRLLAAKRHLEEFIAWIDRPGNFPAHAEREDQARARELLLNVEALQVQASAAKVARSSAPSTPVAPAPPRHRVRPRPLIITGAVFLGAAGATAITTGVLLGRAPQVLEADPQGEPWAGMSAIPYYVAGYSTLGATAVFAAVGTPLLATGLVRRKRQRTEHTFSVTPSGVVWRGRF